MTPMRPCTRPSSTGATATCSSRPDAVMPHHGLARLDIEIDLRAAIERSELHLVYQPTIDLRTGPGTGAEALFRWEPSRAGARSHPSISSRWPRRPACIVPDRRLGARRGLPTAERLAESARSDGSLRALSVNLSGRQLAEGHVVDLVADLLDRISARPGQPVPRDHRERVDGSTRPGPSTAWPSSGPRRQAQHRRLRDRVLVPALPPAVPGQRAEDRPPLRGRPRSQS